MKLSFIRNLGKNIIMQVLSFILILVIGVGVVYAWSAIDRNTAASGQHLTSTMMQGIIDRVNDALVPTGAVMAFNLAACPTGWAEYTPAYGRFIRGIDKSGTAIDPDGQRALGNIQADNLKAHIHSISLYSAGAVIYAPLGASTGIPQAAGTTESFGGTETRSKNVALLYCQKN